MPRTKQNSAGDGVWAVSLAFQILEALAASETPKRVTDLANDLGTSKTRIFRYLQTLKNLGYIVQETDTERYQIGVRLALLGNAAAKRIDLLSIARPVLRELREETRMSVVISKVEEEQIYIVDKLDGPATILFTTEIGAPLPLNGSAQGKLLLAYAGPALFRRTVEKGLKPLTPNTIVDADLLAAELRRIRKNGWASAPNQILTGLNVVAVPVFDVSHRIVSTVGVLGSVDALPAEPPAELIAAMRRAADKVAHQVFGSPNQAPAEL